MKSPTLQDRLAARAKPAGSPVMFQTCSDLLFLHREDFHLEGAPVSALTSPGVPVEIFPLRKVNA